MLNISSSESKFVLTACDFYYFFLQHYGTHDFPCYNLTAMAAPVALFSGGKDDLADPTDVAKLKAQLNPSKIVYEYNIDYYSHLGKLSSSMYLITFCMMVSDSIYLSVSFFCHADFIWGLDAYNALYPYVLSVMNKYWPAN